MSFLDCFDSLTQINDPSFGLVQIWKSKDTQQLAFSQTLPKNYQIDVLKKRGNWQHNSILQLHAAELHEQEEKIFVYYEYLTNTLSNFIIDQFNSQNYIPITEIWTILCQLLDALLFLKLQNTYNGNLRPSTIYLDFEGNIKICENSLFQKQQSLHYPAPEFFENQQLNFNLEKVDVFGLGVTMLEVCTLDSSYVIYDFSVTNNVIEYFIKRKQIDYEFVEFQLQKIEFRYGKFLGRMIREMMNRQENKRPTLQELKQVLQPYEDRIKQRIRFDPDKNEIESNSQKQEEEDDQIVDLDQLTKLRSENDDFDTSTIKSSQLSQQLSNNRLKVKQAILKSKNILISIGLNQQQ